MDFVPCFFLFCFFFLGGEGVVVNIGKNISKYISSKCSSKIFDHAKHSTADTLKTASKKQFKELLKQIVIWLNKVLIKLKKSQELHNRIFQKQLELIQKSSFYTEIPKERYISPDESQKIIDDIRLI